MWYISFWNSIAWNARKIEVTLNGDSNGVTKDPKQWFDVNGMNTKITLELFYNYNFSELVNTWEPLFFTKNRMLFI